MKSVINTSLRQACLLLLVAVASALTARAQDMRLQLDNLDKLESKATESVDVTLDGQILRLAVAFLKDSNPEERAIKELVLGLKGIYVRAYEFDKEGEFTAADVEGVRAQLRSPNWERMVGVKSRKDGDNLEVYTTTTGSPVSGQVSGLTVLTTGSKEFSVIQIVGAIDLEKLIKLSGKLGIPSIQINRDGKEPKE